MVWLIAVGAAGDNTIDTEAGCVYILFLNTNGTVKSYQKVTSSQLAKTDKFGESITTIGDLNNDGVNDLVVGTFFDDDGGNDRGAIYIIFLNSDGTVKSEQKISDLAGGFTATLKDNDNFGTSVANIGDLDNDGVLDIAVGAFNGGTNNKGAIFILFLKSDGTVNNYQEISNTAGGFENVINGEDDYAFGAAITSLDDLDNDGIIEIFTSAFKENDASKNNQGAGYILFMNTNGTVKSYKRIAESSSDYPISGLNADVHFGRALSKISLTDDNSEQVTALVMAADSDNDGGTHRGAIHIIHLDKCYYPEIVTPLSDITDVKFDETVEYTIPSNTFSVETGEDLYVDSSYDTDNDEYFSWTGAEGDLYDSRTLSGEILSEPGFVSSITVPIQVYYEVTPYSLRLVNNETNVNFIMLDYVILTHVKMVVLVKMMVLLNIFVHVVVKIMNLVQIVHNVLVVILMLIQMIVIQLIIV